MYKNVMSKCRGRTRRGGVPPPRPPPSYTTERRLSSSTWQPSHTRAGRAPDGSSIELSEHEWQKISPQLRQWCCNNNNNNYDNMARDQSRNETSEGTESRGARFRVVGLLLGCGVVVELSSCCSVVELLLGCRVVVRLLCC